MSGDKTNNSEKLLVSSSPHISAGASVRGVMLTVILALSPACAAGVWFFGAKALCVIINCVVFCVIAELLWNKFAGKPMDSWKDCSAMVTGVILAMNLSPDIPWWVCLIGSFIGIIFGKQLFGGLGHNPFNPAIVARIALLIAFPKLMTTWVPTRFMMDSPNTSFDPSVVSASAEKALKSSAAPFLASFDGITCATPLGIVKAAKESAAAAGGSVAAVFDSAANAHSCWSYFLGDRGGCLGETSALALLIGGVLLMSLRIIKWQIPAAYLGTVAVFTAVVHAVSPSATPGPLFHLLTGGLILGAFFIATDIVTSPITGRGALLFGFGCGVITCLIRIWGAYPEGVSFAILIMNALVPLIDRMTEPLPMGHSHDGLVVAYKK